MKKPVSTYQELRRAYLNFFRDREHVVVDPAPLVLQGDATTLFTSSGMQPLVPYLSGKETHSKGKRLVNVQPCLRMGDIDEVGDNRHETFFEMLGNWSLGDYFKEDQLPWVWIFLTDVLQLPVEKLYITVYAGSDDVEKDNEAIEIWKKLGVPEDHIYESPHNWWSRSGPPENMPAGEIGGPDSEIYYDFGEGPHDGPESDEDRFLEIGNSVFIQYEKTESGSLKELPQKNVDFGGGLERILAAIHNEDDVFRTDIFADTIAKIEELTEKTYDDNKENMRIIADHVHAAVFLIRDGVTPSNKEHGYILRRLLRRAAVKMYALQEDMEKIKDIKNIVQPVCEKYGDVYFDDNSAKTISKVVADEMDKFSKTLSAGIREVEKLDNIDGRVAFDLFQSYGFPFELTEELASEKGMKIDRSEFEKAMKEHQEKSRSASAGKFKGGLADTSDQVLKYHTATHLLQKALMDVFGDVIRQEGSNITQKRLRFDTRLDRKPTDEELQKVTDIMNSKIDEALPVYKHVMKKSEAERLGAISFFRDKYGDEVSVYAIGGSEDNPEGAYSMEFCGGPHVSNTADIGKLEIFKVKKIGSQLVRFYVRNAA